MESIARSSAMMIARRDWPEMKRVRSRIHFFLYNTFFYVLSFPFFLATRYRAFRRVIFAGGAGVYTGWFCEIDAGDWDDAFHAYMGIASENS